MIQYMNEADRFLRHLDPEADTFVFQTFHDRKAAGGRTVSGSLTDVWQELARENASGFGVSVTVNDTGGKSRKAENVTRIRAVWQEDDDGFDGGYPLIPSIVVQSSPGKYHRYWLVEGDWPADNDGRDDFKRVMSGMVRGYGSDGNAKDISRALRLPGTVHQKGEPHPVRIEWDNGSTPRRYNRKEIVSAFAGESSGADHVAYAPSERSIASVDFDRLRSALAFIPSDNRDGWLTVGMALHHESDGSEEAFNIWDEWSRGTTAGNYDPKEQHRAWASFRDGHGNPVTIATVFHLARENGWKDQARGDLPAFASRSIRHFQKVHEPDGLTERVIAAVRKRFAGYENQQPSYDEWEGLEQIALVIDAMVGTSLGTDRNLDGLPVRLAPDYLVSALSPGTGKTTVVQEAIREICADEKYADIGIIILLSRLEEIRRYVENCGFRTEDFAVIVSEGKPENDLGRQDDKTKARVLFTTQEGLRTRGKDGTRFGDMDRLFFNGKPRQVRIWDEAIVPSRTLTVSRDDIADMLKPLRQSEKYELADELEGFFCDLRGMKDQNVIPVPDVRQYGSFDDARSWFADDRKDSVEALWKLSGQRVRVRHGRYQGEVVLSYEDILPDDLAPMLVLDASGQFRQTYWFWRESRKGLEFLPSPAKRYDGLTIHHWDRGAGRKAYKGDYLSIADGVAKTINTDIPHGESVLVVHFLPSKHIPDMKAAISERLEPGRDVHFLTWGKHTATNDYHKFRYIILAGILQYSVPENEAVGRGAKRLEVDDVLSAKDFDGTRLGEIAHNIFQAACRGYVRHSLEGSCPPGCHLYVIFSTHKTTGIPASLMGTIFSGAEVVEWKPVYRLKGKKLQVAEFLLSCRPGIIAKIEIVEHLGIHPNHLGRYLDDELVGYMKDNGRPVTVNQFDVYVETELPF